MPEIKLDLSTLPLDGQRVKWLALKDDAEKLYKEGEYDAEHEMFVTDDGDDFDTAWSVLEWQPINE